MHTRRISSGGRYTYSRSRSRSPRRSRRRKSRRRSRKRRSSYSAKRSCLKKELQAMERNYGRRVGKTKVRIKNVDHSDIAVQIFTGEQVFWVKLEPKYLVDLNLAVESKLFIFDIVKTHNYRVIFDAVVIDQNDLCRKGNPPLYIEVTNDKDEFIDAISGKKYKNSNFLDISVNNPKKGRKVKKKIILE